MGTGINKYENLVKPTLLTSKLKCWQEVVSADDNNPIKEATYNPNTFEMWSHGIKRKGRPREGWFKTTRLQYWGKVKDKIGSPYRRQAWGNTPRRAGKIKEATVRKLFE